MNFVQVPPVDLRTLLPNLPPAEAQPEHDDCFDLVSKFLVYPPESRLRAGDALAHPLFARGLPLLLPQSYPREGLPAASMDSWEGRSLADVLAPYLPRPSSREGSYDDVHNQEDGSGNVGNTTCVYEYESLG